MALVHQPDRRIHVAEECRSLQPAQQAGRRERVPVGHRGALAQVGALVLAHPLGERGQLGGDRLVASLPRGDEPEARQERHAEPHGIRRTRTHVETPDLQAGRLGEIERIGHARLELRIGRIGFLQPPEAVERRVAAREDLCEKRGVGGVVQRREQIASRRQVQLRQRVRGRLREPHRKTVEEERRLAPFRRIREQMRAAEIELGGVLPECRLPRERARHREVQFAAPPRIHAREDGLMHAVMAKVQRLLGLAFGEQAIGDGRVQVAGQRIFRHAGGGLQQRSRGPSAQAAHGLEQLARWPRQPRDACGEQVRHVAATHEVRDGPRIPFPPVAAEAQQPVAAQRVQHLHGVEGIAPCERHHGLGQLERAALVQAQHPPDELGHVSERKFRECDLRGPVGARAPAREHRSERVRRVDLRAAIHADDEHSLEPGLANDGVEVAQRPRVGPLQVVQHDHQRPRRSHGRQKVQHRATHSLLGACGIRGRRGRQLAQQQSEFGQLRDQRRGAAERAQDAFAVRGKEILRLREQQPPQAAQRLHDSRRRGRAAVILIELAGHVPAARGRRERPQLVDERALAHTGRTFDQDRACHAALRRRERVLQELALGLAADDALGRREPRGEIAFARDERALAAARERLGQAFEIVQQPLRALIALLRRLGEQPHHDVRERPRHARIDDRGRHGFAHQVVAHQIERIGLVEGGTARGELVQRRAERIEVGALIHRAAGAARLLGSEVHEGADDLAFPCVLPARPGRAGRHRMIEVDQNGLASGRENDVGRIDVPVDDAGPMDSVEYAGELRGQLDRRSRFGRPGAQHVRERGPPAVAQQQRVALARRGGELHHARDAGKPCEGFVFVAPPLRRLRP